MLSSDIDRGDNGDRTFLLQMRRRLFSGKRRLPPHHHQTYIGLGGFPMIVFGHPFVVAVEEDLSCSYGFAFEFNGTTFEEKGRFGFEKELRLFDEGLHSIERISSKTTHFRQCRSCVRRSARAFMLALSFQFFLSFLQRERKRENDESATTTISRSLSRARS